MSDFTSVLSNELLDLCFLHLSSYTDRSTIFTPLTVSKRFHAIMSGSPLYDTIYINRLEQIPQLVCHFIRNPGKGTLVRQLDFQLYGSDRDLGSWDLFYGLAPVLHLLQAIPNVRTLRDPPIVKESTVESLRVLQNLQHLHTIGFTTFSLWMDDTVSDLCHSWEVAGIYDVISQWKGITSLCVTDYRIDQGTSP